MALKGILRNNSWVLGESKEIKTNVFTVFPDMHGVFHFREVEPFRDEKLIMDKTDKSYEILKEIKTFLGSAEKYIKYEIPFKRGIVLYGPPGTGKTATVKMLSTLFAEKSNGVVIQNASDSIENWDIGALVREIRDSDKSKPILLVFDDIKFVDQNLISFMDGQSDSNNCVFLFTTNYFLNLPDPLKRPSRTDLHVEIKGMTDKAADGYMKAKFFDDTFDEMKKTFEKYKVSLTYAVLKEVMILKHIFGLSYDESLKRITSSGCDFQIDEGKLPNRTGLLKKLKNRDANADGR